MQKTLLIFILLCSKLTFAQVIDDFSDGDFTNNPTWTGNTSYFQVLNGSLNTNGPQAASTLYLSTANSLANNVSWQFVLNLEFDPSTTNYPRIYLISNQDDLSATSGKQAYYLQLGSSSSADNFTLVKQNGSATSNLLSLPDRARPTAAKVNVRVRVERDANGRWDIYTDFSGGTNFIHEGFVVDNTYQSTGYFGFYCRYSTASRYNMFALDDVRIEYYLDQSAPQIAKVKSLDDNNIQVDFNESVDAVSALNVANYTLNGLGSPMAINLINSSSVKLTYVSPIPTANYTLTVQHIADLKGNTMNMPLNYPFLHIKSYLAQKGDVVFNEIMAAPSSGTLNKEYFELWNTTDKYIIISGWKYKDASNSTATFSADTLAPKAYRIICAVADVSLFSAYGKTLGISPWPALNNDKDNLTLTTNLGVLIESVAYQDTWYQDSAKKTGFALELINPNSPCGGAFNWSASTASNQGTPGQQNSIYNPNHIDNVAPKLMMVNVISATQIELQFDKEIPLAILTDVNNYSINNGIGKANTAQLGSLGASSVLLSFAEAMLANVENTLTLQNIANCAGVPLDSRNSTAMVLLTDPVQAGELLVSEILFNPKTDGYDFVEIYNPTNRILDLKGLSISNPSLSGNSSSKRLISSGSVYVRPKSYWVLSARPDVVQTQYEVKHPTQMVAISSFPSFNADSGMVKIWREDIGIDSARYKVSMQHPLLKDQKGVSLERVSFDKSANVLGNLQSAAALNGFATPSYQNSQSSDAVVKTANSIELPSKTFSPDNDGFEDHLQINYRLKQGGNLATVNIYDDKGNLVRRLVKNQTIGTSGSLIWDGLNDQSQVCKVGIYIIKMAVFNINGSTDHLTKSCVLAAKLN